MITWEATTIVQERREKADGSERRQLKSEAEDTKDRSRGT